MTLVIQKRDLNILRYVYSFRIVSYEQIRQRYFPKNKDSAARRRIRALCHAHFLKRGSQTVNDRSVATVTLTERGWEMIKDKWKFEVDRPYFKSESPEHDLRLAALHARFEKLSIFGSFMTENLLQSSSFLASHDLYRNLVTLQSDGALAMLDANGKSYLYAVELELSKKDLIRYEAKLASYYQAGGIDGVIYVCADQAIANLISRADSKVCTEKNPIVFWGLESDALTAQGEMCFKNNLQQWIKLF
jgi:hypothetical protein